MSVRLPIVAAQSWQPARLGDLVAIKYGKMLPIKELSESGFPVFGANGVIGCHTKYLYEDEQVLISCRGAYSGKINLSPPQCYVTNNSLVLEFLAQPRVTKRFLFYGLQAVDRSKMVTGSAQPQVTINNAEVLEIPVPPLPEQRRIVAEIEKQFTRLAAGVAALRRVQANLKRYRAAALKAACEGRLVPTEKWPITAMRDVTSIVTKGSSPNWQGFDYCDDGVVFVRSQNVGWGKLDLSDVAHLPAGFNDKEKKSVLKASDVLLNIVGASIGRAAIATSDVAGGNVNQAVAVIRCQQEKILPQFLMIYLLSPATQTLIHSQAVDVARANFSLGDISKMPVPVPALAEQTRIVAEVERRLSVVEELESVVSANLQRATRLRQSILQKAFTGELL